MSNSSKKALDVTRKFLKAWKKLDPAEMYDCCTPTWRLKHKLDVIKEMYSIPITGYSVKSAKKITEVVYDILVTLKVDDGHRDCLVRCICEKGPFLPSIEGEWRINPVSFRDIEKIAKQPI